MLDHSNIFIFVQFNFSGLLEIITLTTLTLHLLDVACHACNIYLVMTLITTLTLTFHAFVLTTQQKLEQRRNISFVLSPSYDLNHVLDLVLD